MLQVTPVEADAVRREAVEFVRHDLDDGRRDIADAFAPTEHAFPVCAPLTRDTATTLLRPEILWLGMALRSGIESIMTSNNKLGTVGIVRPTARAGGHGRDGR